MIRLGLAGTAALGLLLVAIVNGEEKGPYKRILQGDDAKKAAALQKQIDDWMVGGKFADAVKPSQELLALRQRALGAKHWETINARVQCETLKHLAALPDDDLRDFINANTQKAEAEQLYQRGRYAQAERLLHQASTIRRQVLGEQHPYSAALFDDLARSLHAQGKYAEAESLLRQTWTVRRQTLGEQHPDTVGSLNNLALNLDAQSKYVEAEPLYRQALSLFSKVLGEQHPQIARSLNNLALNLHNQGKFAEAESLYRRVLVSHRQVLGEQHSATAISLNNLALNLHAQGKYIEAEPLYRQALAIFDNMPGKQYRFTSKCLNNLANNLEAQAKHAEAELLLRQALAIRRKTLGEQHPDTAVILNNLAGNLQAQGKNVEAESMYRQVLAIFRKALGEQHSHTALSLNNLAHNLNGQGKYIEAEPLLRQALSIRRQTLGEQHADTAQTLNNLANNLYAQGQYAQAEKFWRTAVDVFEVARLHAATSGFDRALFVGKYFNPCLGVAGCLARLGQPADAWRYAEAGLGRGLLDDLTSQTQNLLSPEQQQAFHTRRVRLEQLNRLLLPLFTADRLDDASKARRDQLVKERDSLQAELARQAAEHSRREVWSLQRIQKHIPADAALVFWIGVKAAVKAADPNGEHWGCVVRQRGEPAWVRLPGSGDNDAWTPSDDQLPRRLRDHLASSAAGGQQPARQLARQRLTPLLPYLKAREDLPAVRRLIAVPTGAMAGIPLEVLSNDYTISYAPSGTFFARLQEQHRKLHQPSLLALGNPNFDLPKDKPSPLPERGLLLTLVLSGGNASKAGLRDGDVLLSYNNHPLHELADLKPASSGASVPVQVWRDGKTFEARLSPGQLGVSIDRQPAAEALRRQRDFDALLASRSRDKITSLPASRYEVKALEPLFAKATVLLGSDASEQKLDELASADRLKDYRVLHLATHGEVNLSAALQSSLLLARDHLPDVNEQARRGAKIYDGRLRAATMAASWRLDADLVTLSACQTALGPSGGGDGLLGFSQVLFRKGARSLLLSLWKVDDTATALLMTRFYENWLGKRKDLQASLSKSESLREAKQWLRSLRRAERDRLASRLVSGELRGTVVAAKPVTETTKDTSDTPYAHPRYWAAFILIGDPE